jgi:23S rRNA pseudouridine1911/1915/1917 synthase
MNKEIHFQVKEEMNGLPVKTVLSRYVHLSRREISRLKFTGGLLLNGESCRVTQSVIAGDELHLTFTEKDTAHAERILVKPEILYEDEDLVIVNKPAGMPCHPSHEHLDDDMGTLLKNYYGGHFTVRAVGRLDKDVTGIMIYGKNQPAAARLSKERQELKLHKEYLAIAAGVFKEKKGTLRYSLHKEPGRRTRMIGGEGSLCITDYEVIEEKNGNSLLRISIRTGRTHQIRAGMADFGHPLLGDKMYGGDDTLLWRPALHCTHVHLFQPFNHKEIDVVQEMPEDMKSLLK